MGAGPARDLPVTPSHSRRPCSPPVRWKSSASTAPASPARAPTASTLALPRGPRSPRPEPGRS